MKKKPSKKVTEITPTDFKIVVPTKNDRDNLLYAFYEDKIIVDWDLFHDLEKRTCPHIKTYVDGGIKYCNKCWKALEVTSYRD